MTLLDAPRVDVRHEDPRPPTSHAQALRDGDGAATYPARKKVECVAPRAARALVRARPRQREERTWVVHEDAARLIAVQAAQPLAAAVPDERAARHRVLPQRDDLLRQPGPPAPARRDPPPAASRRAALVGHAESLTGMIATVPSVRPSIYVEVLSGRDRRRLGAAVVGISDMRGLRRPDERSSRTRSAPASG